MRLHSMSEIFLDGVSMCQNVLHAWMHFSPRDIFLRGWHKQQLHSKLPQLLTKALMHLLFTPSSVHLALKKAERVKDQFHVISDGGRIASLQVVAIKRAL